MKLRIWMLLIRFRHLYMSSAHSSLCEGNSQVTLAINLHPLFHLGQQELLIRRRRIGHLGLVEMALPSSSVRYTIAASLEV